MGILLVYDVSDQASFDNVRNWMRQIDQNAAGELLYACSVWWWDSCWYVLLDREC